MGSHRVFFPQKQQSQKQQAEQQHAFESRREISLRRSVGTVLAGFPTRHFALSRLTLRFQDFYHQRCHVCSWLLFFFFLSAKQSSLTLSLCGIHVQERQNWMTAVVGFSTTSSPSGCCSVLLKSNAVQQNKEMRTQQQSEISLKPLEATMGMKLAKKRIYSNDLFLLDEMM